MSKAKDLLEDCSNIFYIFRKSTVIEQQKLATAKFLINEKFSTYLQALRSHHAIRSTS